MTDREFVDLLLDGEEQLFATLVERYTPLMFAIFRRRCRAEDVEDLVQEVWVRLWRNDRRALRQWRGTSLKPYLGAIARNVARDHPGEPPPAPPEDNPHPDEPPNLEGVVGGLLVKELLELAREVLRGENYGIFRLYHVDGWTVKEITRHYKLSVSAVHGRLWRARDALKDRIDGPK